MTSTTTNQQTAAQPIDLDSLPLYFNREYYRVEDVRAALARQQPAARVDRIISASGLAEVSVFLESALKVGTVFYAAAPAAPHAQAEPVKAVERIDSIAFEKGEKAFKSRKRRDAVPYNGSELRDEWFAGYDFASRGVETWRTDLYNEGLRLIAESGLAAPVPQEAEQAAPAAALRKLCDQLDGMTRRLRPTPGTGQNHSYLMHEDVEAYVEEARAALAQPAAPAVTDAARDVLADAKGGAA